MTVASISGRLEELGLRLAEADQRPDQLAAIAQALDELPRLRIEVARELRRDGLTNVAIAELAGVSDARIAQLLGPVDELTARRIRTHRNRPEEVNP